MAQLKSGIDFKPDSQGKVSTTQTGKSIWHQALATTDPSLAERIHSEKQWRKNYIRHIPWVTRTAVLSQQAALDIAQAGLNACYQEFEFTRDESRVSLRQAMESPLKNHFQTGRIKGTGTQPSAWALPYKGKLLSGEQLKAQLETWVSTHIIEQDAAEQIAQMIDIPDHSVLKERAFVLLGASSAMGPIEFLLSHGATVIAIDVCKPELWQRLIQFAEQSAGELIFPVKDGEPSAKTAGANLLTDTPEIADWLVQFEKPLSIGSYAYLDAANHVRVVMGMDAIIQQVCTHHPDVSLNYLMTPTDVYPVPEEVINHIHLTNRRLTWRKPIKQILRLLSGFRWFQSNAWLELEDEFGKPLGIVNSLISQQGPNYNLAKRIQRWRALVAAQQGTLVSCNVAPSAATKSVTHNKIFAAGFSGAEEFGVEVFSPETAASLMAMLMLAQHERPTALPDNPELLFQQHACHGGMWRNPNQMSSILVPGVVIGFIKSMSKRRS